MKGLDGGVLETAFPHLVKHVGEGAVSLTKDVMETDGMVEGGCPGGGVEAEARLSTILGDRGELKEVAGDDELDPAEGFGGVAYGAGEGFELVEEFRIHHADFVDDEEGGSQPSVFGFLVAFDLFHELGDVFFSESDAGERVECHAADVACGEAGRGRDGYAVLLLSIFAAK